MSDNISVTEPVSGEVHITGDHENGEWMILGGMTTLETEKYR